MVELTLTPAANIWFVRQQNDGGYEGDWDCSEPGDCVRVIPTAPGTYSTAYCGHDLFTLKSGGGVWWGSQDGIIDIYGVDEMKRRYRLSRSIYERNNQSNQYTGGLSANVVRRAFGVEGDSTPTATY